MKIRLRYRHIKCGGHPVKYGTGVACSKCNCAWLAGTMPLRQFIHSYLLGVTHLIS